MAGYALCIGINDYPGSNLDLNGCVNDAKDWAAELGKRASVTMLLDKHATGAGIRTAIKNTIAKGKEGDFVVITYSGHGSYVPDVNGDEPDGTDECICPHDVMTNGEIADDELHQLYSAKTDGVRVIVISDSCHSGSITRFNPITTPATIPGRNAPQRRVRFMPPSVFLKARRLGQLGARRATRASSPPGRHAALLLSGCQDVQFSYDAFFNGRPNGAFTFVALSELAKLKKAATYEEWHTAIGKTLPSVQYPQAPNLYGTSTMKKWKIFV